MDIGNLARHLAAYWSMNELATNAVVFMNLLGALLLGALVGYERAYHGRAAGMRTYGLVCMASAGLTVVAGYPEMWFGGQHALAATPDPTRIMQGIVTGIGFLGAGVIVKEGLNISGLTTAASIWAASCIGVLIGIGFYAAAILLAGLSAGTMMWGSRVENWLPAHPALSVSLRIAPGVDIRLDELTALFAKVGYQVAPGSFSIAASEHHTEFKFVVLVTVRGLAAPMDELAGTLRMQRGLLGLTLAHARN